MAMMDSPSNFIFEKHPIPLEASSFVKTKLFYKTGDQGKVIKLSRKEMHQRFKHTTPIT
jgi:hypothetical protein